MYFYFIVIGADKHIVNIINKKKKIKISLYKNVSETKYKILGILLITIFYYSIYYYEPTFIEFQHQN